MFIPKRLRDYPINVAPNMPGVLLRDGTATVYDEISGKNLNPLDIDDKILIYERQVKGWFLDAAQTLKNKENMCFITMMICVSYIEGVEKYRSGSSTRQRSGEFFKSSMRRIFGEMAGTNDQLRAFYSQVRCEMFHNGMSGGYLILSEEYDKALNYNGDDTIEVNVELFLDKIIEDFDGYISDLKTDDVLRSGFDDCFSIVS